jgi:hypothetical protein
MVPTRGRAWSSAAARADLRRTAAAAGVRRRFAPHQYPQGIDNAEIIETIHARRALMIPVSATLRL